MTPTVRKHYWRYRCHVDLETLLDDKGFLLDLQHMLLGDRWRSPIYQVCCCSSPQMPRSSTSATEKQWLL